MHPQPARPEARQWRPPARQPGESAAAYAARQDAAFAAQHPGAPLFRPIVAGEDPQAPHAGYVLVTFAGGQRVRAFYPADRGRAER